MSSTGGGNRVAGASSETSSPASSAASSSSAPTATRSPCASSSCGRSSNISRRVRSVASYTISRTRSTSHASTAPSSRRAIAASRSSDTSVAVSTWTVSSCSSTAIRERSASSARSTMPSTRRRRVSLSRSASSEIRCSVTSRPMLAAPHGRPSASSSGALHQPYRRSPCCMAGHDRLRRGHHLAAAEQLVVAALDVAPRLERHRLQPVPAQQLLRPPAEHAGQVLVAVDHPAVHVLDHGGQRDRVEHLAQHLLGARLGQLRPVAVGDVGDHALDDPRRGRPRRAAACVLLHPADGAVRHQDPVLVAELRPSASDASHASRTRARSSGWTRCCQTPVLRIHSSASSRTAPRSEG